MGNGARLPHCYPLMMLTVGSVFAGQGGFDLGFERAGAKVIWNCEIDANCRKVLRHHWPGVPRFKDVRTVTGAGLRAAGLAPDILVGGFPCTNVSVAGKRAGLAGSESGLFFEFARIAEEAKPEWLVIENVPGLLSSNKGRDMGTVIGTLADAGYLGAWACLDAQWFGVAQRRRRLFFVCHARDGRRAAEVLLEPEGMRGDPPTRNGAEPITTGSAEGSVGGRSRGTGAQGAVGALSANGVWTCGADDNQGQAGHLLAVPDVSNALCSNRGQRNDHNEQTFLPVAYRKMAKAGRSPETWEEGNFANTLGGEGNNSRTSHAVVQPVAFHMTQDPITSEDIAPAIGGVKATTGYATVGDADRGLGVRRLLPVECLRLMAFPDNWLDDLGLADSTKYRMAGNSVVVNVVEWIARRILKSSENPH